MPRTEIPPSDLSLEESSLEDRKKQYLKSYHQSALALLKNENGYINFEDFYKNMAHAYRVFVTDLYDKKNAWESWISFWENHGKSMEKITDYDERNAYFQQSIVQFGLLFDIFLETDEIRGYTGNVGTLLQEAFREIQIHTGNRFASQNLREKTSDAASNIMQ